MTLVLIGLTLSIVALPFVLVYKMLFSINESKDVTLALMFGIPSSIYVAWGFTDMFASAYLNRDLSLEQLLFYSGYAEWVLYGLIYIVFLIIFILFTMFCISKMD